MGEDRKSEDVTGETWDARSAQERLAIAIHNNIIRRSTKIIGGLYLDNDYGQVWHNMLDLGPSNPTPGDVVEYIFRCHTPIVGYCFVVFGREGSYTAAYVDRTKMGRRMTFEEFEPALMYARMQLMEGWEK
jgi:hypothetical protein